MPLSLFGSRPFVGLTLLTFLLYGALGGLLVLLPYALIQAGGYTPLQAGTALLPFPIVIGLGSRLMGQLTARVGPRWPLSIGPAVTAIGLLLLIRIGVVGGLSARCAARDPGDRSRHGGRGRAADHRGPVVGR